MNRIIHIGIALALASLAAAATVAAQAPARPDSSRFLSVRQTSPAYGLASDRQALMEQVRDPLFGFVFTMIEHDSLGTWRADDLLDFAAAWGEPSAFPLAEHLESLTREELPTSPQERRGAICRRQWVVRLRPERLGIPMPYSILGYHPGKLSFDGPIVLREWPLGERSIHVSVEDVTRRYLANAVTVFEIAAGWIILDVDAWLDTLLGSAADDAAMRGFVVGWVDGELVGVGNSAGRKGRRILGELDFRSGEVANHGRPVARGLSSDARAWTSRRSYDPREIWRRYDD